MLPLRDLNPPRRFPLINLGIIGLNVLVFLYQIMLPERELERFVYQMGVVPYRVLHDFSLPAAITFFTSMFMHGGFMHIFGNMLYLHIFGDNVEDALGHVLYPAFYLTCGIGASLAQIMMGPNSRIPAIGASGAIAGVLGAYMVFYPQARVQSLLFLGYFSRLVDLPAIIVLGGWFILQFFNGLLSLGIPQSGGVAWFAHIGGFLLGIGGGLFCKLIGCKPSRARYPSEEYYWRNV